MKKFILSLGLIAMAFGLTNCTKNEEVILPVETKGEFAIYATTETRTANDGLNTVWVAGDDLGVFHAVTDGTTYTKDGQFKLEDVETAKFLGTVNGTLDADEEYDWYAMYPYSSYVPGPANTGSGYMTIGCAASATQTQTGNNSMAHIKGTNYPLVGKAYAVPANQSPALAMTHVATLLEFEVTNSLEEPITVSNIKFTAPEYLVGTFYIDFTDIDNIEVESSGSSYTSKSATLIVKNGEAIKAGESAKFYLPVAPFTANAGAKLSIEVNVTSGEKVGILTKDITLANETSFVAGKIKNVKVNYDAEFVEEGLALPFYDDFSWVKSGQNEGSEITGDNLNKELYATSSKIYPVAAGGEIKFGTSSALGSLTTVPLNLSQPFTVVVDAKRYNTESSKLSVTVNGVTKTTNDNLGAEYETYLFEFDAATAACPVKFDITGKRGFIDEIKIVSGHNYVLPPVLSVDSSIVPMTAEGGSATINYTVENAVDGASVTASADVDWITNVDYSVAGKVSFSVAENMTTVSRAGIVTIAYPGAKKSVDVTVQQDGVSTGAETIAKFDFSEQGYANAKDMCTAAVAIDSNVSIAFNKGSNSNTAKYYTSGTSVRCYGGNYFTVSSTSKTITKIVLTYGTSDGSNAITATPGSFATNTWTGESDSIKFTIGGTSGNRRIKAIEVTYK